MEIEEIITALKLGKEHTLSLELESICGEIAVLSSAWARNAGFALLSFEEAYQRKDVHPWLESWAVLAQNAALSAHAQSWRTARRRPM
jgi:hypothetical protein